MTPPPTVRRATPDDAPALVVLRAAMVESVNGTPPEDNGWRESCEAQLRERLAADDMCIAYVVDGPGGVPVSCGMGWVQWVPPAPSNVSGRMGFVASMSTLPQSRGRGAARAIFAALMAWFEQQGVTRVDLHASDMGEALYREYGFSEPRSKAMTWSRRP